ncbi:MAG: type V CRISPR-associated protein Cas12a/Cpf1, partial [Bacteroidota bacterium]|nr:type V CRISPR-associated protein Cas12a/Cpf1 [Bacteroidota bacterium]
MEDLLQGTRLDELFTLEYFNQTLTQKGIDLYNFILGGRTEKGQKKVKGLNEYINLYRQQNDLKSKELPNLQPLYKQILSDRGSISFMPEAFTTDGELLEAIEKFYRDALRSHEVDGKIVDVPGEAIKLLKDLEKYDLDKIYIANDGGLTRISSRIFGDWAAISNALRAYYTSEKNPLKAGTKITKKYDETKERWVTKSSHFSISDIEKALEQYGDQNEAVKEKITRNTLCDYFAAIHNGEAEDGQTLIQNIDTAYTEVKDLLNTPWPENKNLAQDKNAVEKIKTFLDSLMTFLHFIKPLHPKTLAEDKDEAFYSAYLRLFDQLNLLTELYDKTRNYLTRKPYSVEKYKLNFENSTLMDGWDLNKE